MRLCFQVWYASFEEFRASLEHKFSEEIRKWNAVSWPLNTSEQSRTSIEIEARLRRRTTADNDMKFYTSICAATFQCRSRCGKRGPSRARHSPYCRLTRFVKLGKDHYPGTPASAWSAVPIHFKFMSRKLTSMSVACPCFSIVHVRSGVSHPSTV